MWGSVLLRPRFQSSGGKMENDTECKECGFQFQRNTSEKNNTCPQCGSNKIMFKLCLIETETEHELIKLKTKDDRFPSKKKMRKERTIGESQRKTDGKWMDLERFIDKDNDKYKKTIVDPETNKVVYHCEEPLSEHINRGSAKKKKKSD